VDDGGAPKRIDTRQIEKRTATRTATGNSLPGSAFRHIMRLMSDEPKLLAIFRDGSSQWISEQDAPAARAGGTDVTVVGGTGNAWSWDRGLFKG